MIKTHEDKDFEIETFFKIEKDYLTVNYNICNLSKVNMYISDYIWNQNESELEKNDVYGINNGDAHVYVKNDIVILGKDCFQLSFNASGIVAYDNTFVIVVPPGGYHEGSISKALPLVPYKVNDTRPSECPAIMMGFMLNIDYYLDGIDIQESIEKVATTAGPAFEIPLHLSRYKKTITVGPYEDKIPVLNSKGGGVKASDPSEKWVPWG